MEGERDVERERSGNRENKSSNRYEREGQRKVHEDGMLESDVSNVNRLKRPQKRGRRPCQPRHDATSDQANLELAKPRLSSKTHWTYWRSGGGADGGPAALMPRSS